MDNGNGATLYVTFSTFSGNQLMYTSTYGNGGAIAVMGGGGVHTAVANLKSNIFANSYKANPPNEPIANCWNDPYDSPPSYIGIINDVGYNISDDSSCNFTSSTLASTDPMLDPNGLKDNSGPTETIALQSGSPAIDAIPVSDCTDQASPANPITTDQRGVIRPQGPGCDIGAYEALGDATPPDITITSPIATTYTISQLVAADYSCSDPDLSETETISCVGTVADGAYIDTSSL